MRYIRLLVTTSALCGLALLTLVCTENVQTRVTQDREIDKLVGDWTGESICANRDKFPSCKDERVVYHLSLTKGKSNGITINADKIVDGKPEDMGATDYVYDPEKQTLKGEFQNSRVHLSFEFVVKGDILEGGIFSLPERTQSRNIKVRKNRT